jgi:PAS domain S-box-containing protein
MEATRHAESGSPPGMGRIRAIADDLASRIDSLGVAGKIYGFVALLVVVTTLLLVISIQSVRLQAAYRHQLTMSATAAVNIERVNSLIYAIVMESRGIYMSADRAKARSFEDELLKRNRELADVVAGWEEMVRLDDTAQFSAFKNRIMQFIDFRAELVRRAAQIGTVAAREWGDNDANRSLRSELNTDLEAFARIYVERTRDVDALGDQGRYAAWYLFVLGLSALAFAILIVFVARNYVIGPLSEITEATDRIAAGNLEFSIPFITRNDEIGRLAHAVQNFRDVTRNNVELQQREFATAKQRDAAIGQRDKLDDKYHTKKWQLDAALNNMPQGVVMLDAKARVLLANKQFKTMYALPPKLFESDCTLKDILAHRVKIGSISGDIDVRVFDILARIAKRQPSIQEVVSDDGRVFRISEQPVAGGGWIATHEEITEQRRAQRILERTERFLVTVVENIPEGIVAKDARNLRYVFVNRAAEKMIGMSRAEIMGKTARELFPVETAELIERRDRQLLAENGQLGPVVDTVNSPDGSRRTVAVRRLQIGGPEGESNVFLSMIDDRTDTADVAAQTSGMASSDALIDAEDRQSIAS